VSGCSRSGALIENVNDTPVVGTNKTVPQAQVRSAIIAAGAGLGWQITDAGPNKLLGTLNLRTHTAVVDIPYSASTYSILYKSSINLNESGGTIHPNYNSWVRNLDNAIRQEIARR
jgi:hypothetical protein